MSAGTWEKTVVGVGGFCPAFCPALAKDWLEGQGKRTLVNSDDYPIPDRSGVNIAIQNLSAWTGDITVVGCDIQIL
jgi:hypothetical protein